MNSLGEFLSYKALETPSPCTRYVESSFIRILHCKPSPAARHHFDIVHVQSTEFARRSLRQFSQKSLPLEPVLRPYSYSSRKCDLGNWESEFLMIYLQNCRLRHWLIVICLLDAGRFLLNNLFISPCSSKLIYAKRFFMSFTNSIPTWRLDDEF